MFSTAATLQHALTCLKAGCTMHQQQEQQTITVKVELFVLKIAVQCILQLKHCVQ